MCGTRPRARHGRDSRGTNKPFARSPFRRTASSWRRGATIRPSSSGQSLVSQDDHADLHVAVGSCVVGDAFPFPLQYDPAAGGCVLMLTKRRSLLTNAELRFYRDAKKIETLTGVFALGGHYA